MIFKYYLITLPLVKTETELKVAQTLIFYHKPEEIVALGTRQAENVNSSPGYKTVPQKLYRKGKINLFNMGRFSIHPSQDDGQIYACGVICTF